jgi:hypothetical protein
VVSHVVSVVMVVSQVVLGLTLKVKDLSQVMNTETLTGVELILSNHVNTTLLEKKELVMELTQLLNVLKNVTMNQVEIIKVKKLSTELQTVFLFPEMNNP